MQIIEMIFASSYLSLKVMFPILRTIYSALFGVAISKDCKSRDNGSSALWGFLAFISPVIFGIIYLIYSRFYSNRKPKSEEDFSNAKKAKLFFLISIFVFAITQAIFVISVISLLGSTFAGLMKQ